MRAGESHGRLPYWQVGIIIAVPTLVALAGGIWLALQVMDGLEAQRAYEKAGTSPMGLWLEIGLHALLVLGAMAGSVAAAAGFAARKIASRRSAPMTVPSTASVESTRAVRETGPSLSIQEMPSSGIARSERELALEGRVDAQGIHPHASMNAQALEAALNEELLASPARVRGQRQKRIAVARFETEIQDMAADSSVGGTAILRKLAAFASELSDSPVLVFRFVPEAKTALLHAYAGFEQGQAPRGASVAVTDELAANAARAAREGKILGLSEYVPLAALLLKSFLATNYRAWVLSDAQGSLLGFLVVLQAGESLLENSESLARVIRATGDLVKPSSTGNNATLLST